MALYQVNAGDRILAADSVQFYNLLKGVAASGESITLVYNAAGSVILQPSSDPAAGTEAIQIKNNAGAVQGSLTFDGKVKVADGTAALPSLRFESEASGLYLSAAGVVGIGVAGADSNVKVGASFISVGATPATSGNIRLPNNTSITEKNSGGTDIDILKITSGDVIQLGNTGATPILLGTTGGVTVSSPGKIVLAGTLTGGGLTTVALQVATSGPLIYSGSGAPTINAAVKGSLYLRSDGASNVTRAYIATDAAGTWTAVNTVA